MLDEHGRIRSLHHTEYHQVEKSRGREAAAAYVGHVAGKLAIPPAALRNLDQAVTFIDPREQDVEYRFSEEKRALGLSTYGYYQTYLNTPVWNAGLSVTIKQAPTRVVSATDTSARDIDAKLPPREAIERFRRLFMTAEKAEPQLKRLATKAGATDGGAAGMAEVLGKSGKAVNVDVGGPEGLIRGRFFIYQYDAAKRSEDFPKEEATPEPKIGAAGTTATLVRHDLPTLPLPPVPTTIRDGSWRLVAELVFRMPFNKRPMNWRVLVDVETGAILYVRALASGVSGWVFPVDPITGGVAAGTPAATSATLNGARGTVSLLGLVPPAPGANQALTGEFIQISDFEPATAAPPTAAVGASFNYDARTNNFAAVNAYYHCDRFFRLVQDLGFQIEDYFDGTSFPVPVDHRGRFGTADGVERNASCSGDGDGIASVDFELADLGDTANPIGIAADWRVVLHELGGHGIIYDHFGTANFGFSHSAGDSFAVILNDPDTQAADRFESFPWVSFVGRRHDRAVGAGWGWGGVQDTGGYSSEQILSTTMFRIYRSLGGDSISLDRRQFAARYVAYLMLQAVNTMVFNPATPNAFLAGLLAADDGEWASEGMSGKAYGKVMSWAFEKQNLNSGAPPSVDVYIDDGRAGEYDYLPVHWGTTTIWNRRAPDGLTAHQEAALGAPNYAYVKIKNRGTTVANNVVVKGFHCKPSAGVRWPTDLQPFTTAQLSAGSLQPNNAEEKIIGPFEWTPILNAWGHDCMMMMVSAAGDPANVDNFTALDSIEDWRLVPNDNNVGQRNVTVVPGGGGVAGLTAGLQGKGFWIGNPGLTAALTNVTIELPPLLTRRGWRLTLRELPAGGVRLKPGEQRLVTFEVHAGASFTRAEVEVEAHRDIVVTATSDDAIIGGMVYRVDPELEMPYNDVRRDDQQRCRDQAGRLLDCLDLPGEKVKCVRVRKVAIDIEIDDDGCCG